MGTAKDKKKDEPKDLTVEFHYNDGDVGAYSAKIDGDDLKRRAFYLWRLFSDNPSHKPSHIVIRPDTEVGQELSNALHAAYHVSDPFVKSKGSECPHCGSDQIEGDSFDVDDGNVSQEMSCRTCNSTWTAQYWLTGYTDLAAGDVDDSKE